ncbi:hypothetical protein [Spiroplasma endosymbiont of Lonchoptera lutea]|uniref:hypothetical protein n=1 Tax=Spiroplasma endosymbiont of Lonchoptera lutea TaxID=3066297 RepID=UPI0030D4EAFC
MKSFAILFTCTYKYNSANENTNGLIREKFPKKFNFSNTTKNAVHKFILSLNQRPRKILNYLSPIEYLVRKII